MSKDKLINFQHSIKRAEISGHGLLPEKESSCNVRKQLKRSPYYEASVFREQNVVVIVYTSTRGSAEIASYAAERLVEGEVEEELDLIREKEKQVTFELSVATQFPIVDFYFYFKNGQWYLFGITTNDCSA